MKTGKKMENNNLNKTSITLKSLKNNFDTITSNNGKDWFLALIWILVFEFISSILEYEFLDKAKYYIEPLSNGLAKEFFIAFLIVVFIWYSIYNFIFMRKNQFFILTLYTSICVYLLITNDITFNLFLHNLNPLEVIIDGFGFYMIFQIILKFLMLYLIYKMLLAVKNRKIQKEE
jgi:hypothetical protein